jgi:hypothetical protein
LKTPSLHKRYTSSKHVKKGKKMKVSSGGEGSGFSMEAVQAELAGGGVAQLTDGVNRVEEALFGPADGVDVVPFLQHVISGAFPDEIVTAWDSRNVEYRFNRRKIGGVLGVRVQTITTDGGRTRQVLIDDEHRHGLPEPVIAVLGRPAVYWASLPPPAGGILVEGQSVRDIRALEVSSPHYKPARYVY